MAERFAELSPTQLRQITHVLLLEWAGNVSVSPRGTFVDFGVISLSALGLQHKQRFRLFPHPVTTPELQQLQKEATVVGLDPVAVVPLGLKDGTVVPPGVEIIRACRVTEVGDLSVSASNPRGTRCSSWVEKLLFFLLYPEVCNPIALQEPIMEEQGDCTSGVCPGASATGETVSLYVDHNHPLLQLKRALPWEALGEVMTRP